MRSALPVFALLLLLTGCAVTHSQTANPSDPTQPTKLPDFVNDPQYGLNEDLAAPLQKLIYFRNLQAMKEIVKHDPAVVQEEMLKRLSPDQPMSLRLLAAAVLVLKNDEHGRQFFIAQSKIPQDLGDLYVTLNHLFWTGEVNELKVDWSWADDFMIEALQNRTRINRRAALALPRNISWDETIEIREMAVQYGAFCDHLARMRSEKALPVLLSLLGDHSFPGLNGCLGYVGRYKDERVGRLLMDVLTNYRESKHADAYRFAVAAASDMELKAAVPVLLRHLNDEDSYAGLVVLGDASVVPAIKAALPRLKSYARAEAELAIIRLKGGDIVPALLQLLRRTDYLRRDDVIMWLEELKDPRTVPTMTSILCKDPDWFVRLWSISVLAAVKNKDAIQGLVNGLGCDYSKLTRFKTNSDHDFNTEYRGEIAKALKKVTGEDFGTDQKRWTVWLTQQKAF